MNNRDRGVAGGGGEGIQTKTTAISQTMASKSLSHIDIHIDVSISPPRDARASNAQSKNLPTLEVSRKCWGRRINDAAANASCLQLVHPFCRQ